MGDGPGTGSLDWAAACARCDSGRGHTVSAGSTFCWEALGVAGTVPLVPPCCLWHPGMPSGSPSATAARRACAESPYPESTEAAAVLDPRSEAAEAGAPGAESADAEGEEAEAEAAAGAEAAGAEAEDEEAGAAAEAAPGVDAEAEAAVPDCWNSTPHATTSSPTSTAAMRRRGALLSITGRLSSFLTSWSRPSLTVPSDTAPYGREGAGPRRLGAHPRSRREAHADPARSPREARTAPARTPYEGPMEPPRRRSGAQTVRHADPRGEILGQVCRLPRPFPPPLSASACPS